MKLRFSSSLGLQDCLHLRSILSARCPAEAEGICPAVEFALNDIVLTAVVKAEYFVGQIQTLNEKSEILAYAVAGLCVDLQVRIEINIAGRAPRTQVGSTA